MSFNDDEHLQSCDFHFFVQLKVYTDNNISDVIKIFGGAGAKPNIKLWERKSVWLQLVVLKRDTSKAVGC